MKRKTKKKTEWKAMSLRLPVELYKAVKEAANKDRRSVMSWIRIVIEDRLKEDEAS